MSTIYALKSRPARLSRAWVAANGSKTGLAAGYTAVVSTAVGTQTCLLGYNATSGAVDFYTVKPGALGKLAVKAAGSATLGPGWDIVQPFTINNGPALVAYQAKTGNFGFFAVNAVGKVSGLVTKPLPAQPGLTLVQPYLYRGTPYLLGYNTNVSKANNVFTYQLGPASTKPIASQALGAWTWANGWTRFAFFQFGGEWFFIKTNTAYKTVFLDHAWDDPSTYPSHPVAEKLPLNQNLQAVVATTLEHFPYFITYLPNGAATVNQVWGDGTGWTTTSSTKLQPKASLVLSFTIGTAPYVLTYG